MLFTQGQARKTLTVGLTDRLVSAILEKVNFKVTLTVNTKGHDFVSTVDDDDDLYRAVDKAVAKVEAQMAKAIDKIKDIHHDNVRIADVLKD